MRSAFILSLALSASAVASGSELGQALEKREVQMSEDTLNKVRQVAYDTLEYSHRNPIPLLLPLRLLPLPPSSSTSLRQSIPIPIIDIARQTLQNRPTSNSSILNNPMRGQGLLEDGSSADPASLGIAVLMASASDGPGSEVINGVTYEVAAEEELQYQLYNVPRTSSGAISHRADQAQLWADFVYMVPPFLAYYGFVTDNQTLLQTAYDQCRLYRSGLQDPSTQLWKHIQEGRDIHDDGLWATGNAWAAAGMLRVLATIQRSNYAGEMGTQTSDLGNWVGEIVTACKNRVNGQGLVPNYVDNSTSFGDTAASSLLAYSAFRMSTMGISSDHTGFANQVHSTVVGNYISGDGTLQHAVDPLEWEKMGEQSPEGQAFVMLMQQAYTEYRSSGGSDDTSSKGAAAALGVGPAQKWLVIGATLAAVTFGTLL